MSQSGQVQSEVVETSSGADVSGKRAQYAETESSRERSSPAPLNSVWLRKLQSLTTRIENKLIQGAGRGIGLLERLGLPLGKRRGAPSGHPYRDIDPRQMWARKYLSWRYIRGHGVEIGALHCPLPLYHGARSKYVDYIPLAEIRKHYPELEGFAIAEPDIIDDAEQLTKVAPGSQDYIVANHFIEHCENPIGTIRNLLSKLKPGGRIFMAVPMRDATFDRTRALTPTEHVFDDYLNGHERSRWTHYREWAEHVAHAPAGEIDSVARELLDRHYSIHYHVWNYETFRELLEAAILRLDLPMRVISATRWSYNPFESVYIIEKSR